MPGWLHWLAAVSVASGLSAAVVIVIDLVRGHRQHMWIMNVVWPVTALWSGPLGLWAYFTYGRAGDEPSFQAARAHDEPPPNKRQPFAVLVAKGTTHCGAGCTLADIVAEWVIVAVPLVVLGHHIFGAWIYDFVLAFALGIAFQYFTIKPMRDLSPGRGLLQALKADTLSLTAWQLGMFGWMALATFVIFRHELPKTSPVFWFMMQLGMFAGFVTSYPVNWWLLRSKIKEAM